MSAAAMHKTETARKTITLLTIADAIDLALAQEYLVKGLIEPGTFNLIYGEPSSGKSFVALHMAFCVANAMPVFNRRVKPARVLYVSLEGERAFCRRVTAADSRMKNKGVINFFFATEALNLMNGDGHPEALVAAARDINARLIFIDTLARAMGPGSENEQGDMGALIEAFDYVRAETGAALVVVHHSGKDSSRGPRGHSSLIAAADTAIEILREDDDRSMKVVKCKDGIDGETIAFALDVVDLGADSDGDRVTSCVVRDIGAVSRPKNENQKLTTAERGYLKDVIGLFLDAEPKNYVTPRDKMPVTQVLTRDQIRDGLKALGKFEMSRDTISEADRKNFGRVLNSLKDKGKIGMTEKYIWLIKTP